MNDSVPVRALGAREVGERLANDHFVLRTGPFRTAIRSRDARVHDTIMLLYADHLVEPPGGFADFHVEVKRVEGLRGWLKPQAVFELDGARPFMPLPLPQSFALLEWGMNWCIANFCHQYLMVHAAVIERDGLAAILPAPPGSGKSTLCAALVHRGWRLLSDEMTLIVPASGEVVGLARPINLKNASIDIIRDFAPQAVFGPVVPDTKKGTVAHLKPPADSLAAVEHPARPRWIVFPKYEAGSPPQLESLPPHRAFIHLAENSFNYSVLGEHGFDALGRVVDGCDCLNFRYSQLDDAVACFERLLAEARR